MAFAKVQLTRNLRRQVLRGHPWIYKEATKVIKSDGKSTLAEISDQKGQFLGWGIFDSQSPLQLRILSLEKKPPQADFVQRLMEKAVSRRRFLNLEETNCFRLINGEGDQIPGFVCDIYHRVAVIQFDGEGAEKFWEFYPIVDMLKAVVEGKFTVETIISKTRGKYQFLEGKPLEPVTVIRENGLQYAVDIEKGQKTGFFLDQRDNRHYVKSLAKGKSVMNLFSYTGGFSIAAGAGGASKVLSVDLSKQALELAQKSWDLNSLHPVHTTEAKDIFEYMAESQTKWDMVIVDPPSMAHSEKQREGAISKYIETFTVAAKQVERGGDLILSSCSSHVSFEDFFSIITESLSGASRRGIVQRVSGQGADHPFPHVCPELRYLKFVHLELN